MPSLFSSPKAPSIPSPVVQPTPNDGAIKAAQQAQMAQVMARSGRQSTILSQNQGASDKLG